MATANLTDSSLRLQFETGIDGEGYPIYQYKTFNNVKPTATATELYAIATALQPLQIHSLNNVERKDSSTIVGP